MTATTPAQLGWKVELIQRAIAARDALDLRQGRTDCEHRKAACKKIICELARVESHCVCNEREKAEVHWHNAVIQARTMKSIYGSW